LNWGDPPFTSVQNGVLTLTRRKRCDYLSMKRWRNHVQDWRVLKIAQVSGRLLRYYDELGLLKPVPD
jgi:hypothetical protein